MKTKAHKGLNILKSHKDPTQHWGLKLVLSGPKVYLLPIIAQEGR